MGSPGILIKPDSVDIDDDPAADGPVPIGDQALEGA